MQDTVITEETKMNPVTQVPVDRLMIKSNDLRNAEIKWHSYLQGHMINEAQYSFISDFDMAKSDSLHKVKVIKENGVSGLGQLFSLINSMSKDQTVCYLLTRLDEIIEEIIDVVAEDAKSKASMPWTMFTTLMKRQDQFIAHMSARLVAKITTALAKEIKMEGTDLELYFGWLRSQLNGQNNDYLQSTVACLQRILRVPYYRVAFFKFGGLDCIAPLLTNHFGFQLQYQVCCCIWMMSYDVEISKELKNYPKVLWQMSDILKDSQKEKVLRMIVATFVNILNNAQESESLLREFTLIMITAKVPRSLELIIETHCNKEESAGVGIATTKNKEIDIDLAEDCEKLQGFLQEADQKLSSYDEYVGELLSGRLNWTPVHKSQKFWRENVHKFNENKYLLLHKLAAILESRSSDAVELQVACHDLGEYTRYYPRGKAVLDTLKIKNMVMQLLTNRDKLVKYQALLAVQKMMVQDWEYLAKNNSGGKALTMA